MSTAFCGFEIKVGGPKGGTRLLRVEVAAGDTVTFRLDGVPIFGSAWTGELGPLFERLASDARGLAQTLPGFSGDRPGTGDMAVDV